MSKSPRQLAVQALAEVLPAEGGGRSLREVLARPRGELSAGDRGLFVDLCYGVCRHRRLLDHWLSAQLQKPLRASAQPVRLALWCALYELWFSARPAHAVVNAYPDLMRQLKAPWAAGLANALLRKATREDINALQASLPTAVAHSLPDWLWQQLQRDWGEQAPALAAASLLPAPLTLRVNRQQHSREQALLTLAAAGLPASASSVAPFAVTLHNAVPVHDIPGFTEGAFSVQDAVAQNPVEWLDMAPQGRVLDACAAPGGKTGQLLERFPDAEVVALDVDRQRLARVQENLDRIGLKAQLQSGDAADPSQWWDGQLFDAVLLDAPCTATGILRRQPDVKWHRRASDVPELVGLQARMLDAIWPLIRPGGCLVYATCSVLDAENADQMAAFLARTPDARADSPGSGGSIGQQWAPTTQDEDRNHDGFYCARLRKQL